MPTKKQLILIFSVSIVLVAIFFFVFQAILSSLYKPVEFDKVAAEASKKIFKWDSRMDGMEFAHSADFFGTEQGKKNIEDIMFDEDISLNNNFHPMLTKSFFQAEFIIDKVENDFFGFPNVTIYGHQIFLADGKYLGSSNKYEVKMALIHKPDIFFNYKITHITIKN